MSIYFSQEKSTSIAKTHALTVNRTQGQSEVKLKSSPAMNQNVTTASTLTTSSKDEIGENDDHLGKYSKR